MSGTVVARSGDKTVKVRIERATMHPLYGGKIMHSKSFLVHDPKNEVQVGQRIEIRECRPISRKKRWTVVYGA